MFKTILKVLAIILMLVGIGVLVYEPVTTGAFTIIFLNLNVVGPILLIIGIVTIIRSFRKKVVA